MDQLMSTRSPITTHVLDISHGKAAAGIAVTLERQISATEWKALKSSATNADGRVEDLLPPGSAAEAGVYRLTFDTGAYFSKNGGSGFYPFTSIAFEITQPKEHHHVPLLLSPYGYSTYRGT
jgi:5-hydroxyisourate hydrolase